MTMKIYTKTGDGGDTGLWGGKRVPKDDIRVEAYGTVDELNAALGVAIACEPNTPTESMTALLTDIQSGLFALGAELASPADARPRSEAIGADHIATLEAAIDHAQGPLPALKSFVLPAGTQLAASLHMARAICRRAERCCVTLARDPQEGVRREPLIYLNRLSDLLFVLARAANHNAGVVDVPWVPIKLGAQ